MRYLSPFLSDNDLTKISEEEGRRTIQSSKPFMAAAVSVPTNRTVLRLNHGRSPTASSWNSGYKVNKIRRWGTGVASFPPFRRALSTVVLAGSRAGADDSASSEMSVENALKLLGLKEGASFEDIMKAKNLILASCKDDEQAIAQVEAAYDMLLMQSLSQRRSGKVENTKIRYADVKPINAPGVNSVSRWFQTTTRTTNAPVSIDSPSLNRDLGLQVGAYGVLMVLCYANEAAATSSSAYNVPGLILATSFGASLYFLAKKKVTLGKATVITIGGLVAGAAVGSGVESWLQVDIVPFLGIHSPATIVGEFILFSQLLVSLYLI